MATIFTQIAKGEIPSYKVAENQHYYAFLDINPLTIGHTLVIPKHTEETYLFNLSDGTYMGLMIFAKQVAKAIEKTISCQRVGMMVIGLEVPHTHIHLIPISKESDMNISQPKLKLPKEQMTDIAQQIQTVFEQMTTNKN